MQEVRKGVAKASRRRQNWYQVCSAFIEALMMPTHVDVSTTMINHRDVDSSKGLELLSEVQATAGNALLSVFSPGPTPEPTPEGTPE